jgi:beta-galactosidase/beta-glucuronidase
LSINIPARWKEREIFLSFEGVDDLYDLYVNGVLAGKSGDLATRKDAFNEKKSYRITHLVRAGDNTTIAVRVQDWGGAGGIFRPVTLGTAGFSPRLMILK